MNKAIIDGVEYELVPIRNEVTSLPEKWYTDGTPEANEWGINYCRQYEPYLGFMIGNGGNFVAAEKLSWESKGHTYITPAQFNEWKYKPWKESLKPKAPTTIEEVLEIVNPVWKHDDRELEQIGFSTQAHAKSVLALCQLYNVAKCLNECFEGDEEPNRFWTVLRDREIYDFGDGYYINTEVIRFTSREAAQHAADHFWHLFADFYMLEDEQY